MIADLDETIRQLLIAEIPIKNGEIDIKFEQPKREWSAKLTKPTVNLFLYDVRENPELRKHGWQQLPQNGQRHTVTQKRMPFRVDCHYMMTVWAAEPEDEHRLMTRSMLALFRHPVLEGEMLAEGLRHQMFPIRTYLARHDRLTNPAEVWSSLDNEMRPSISYVVTLALDPWAEITGPAVSTYILRVGRTEGPANLGRFTKEGFDIELITIGGTVYDKAKDGTPQPGIDVTIKGTGFASTTDSEGRFILGSFPAGEYTLVLQPPDGKSKEKKVTVPAAADEYDLTL
jgi:hypothetical protein